MLFHESGLAAKLTRRGIDHQLFAAERCCIVNHLVHMLSGICLLATVTEFSLFSAVPPNKYSVSTLRLLILFETRKNCHSSGRSLSLCLFIRGDRNNCSTYF
jgi:hypothetical protein